MGQFTFSNFVNTTLASPVSSTATTITLASSANLPSPSTQFPFAIVLNDAATRSIYEIVYATAISGATLTVLRGQEGTSAQSWLTGDYAYDGITAGQMASQGGFNNPMTTAGDIIIGGFNGTPTRLALGTSGYVLTAGASGAISWQAIPSVTGVSSFNTRTGAVTLQASDVTGALGYTPYSNAGGVISGAVTIDNTLGVTGAVTLSSTLGVTSNASFGANVSVAGNLTVTGTTTTSASDRRIKDNIRPIRNALAIIEHSLVGVEYDFKSGEHAAGFIAQDVEAGLPHLVQKMEHDGIPDFRTLSYNQTIPYLAAAITELHALVRDQSAEIERLKARA